MAAVDQVAAPANDVPAQHQPQGRSILVPLDESEESQYALQWALKNMVNSGGGDRLHLLHVQAIPAYYPDGPGFYFTEDVIDSVQKRIDADTRAIFEKAVASIKEYNVKFDSLILKGDAREGIIAAVEKLSPTVLVMGSRGKGVLKRAFLGSVSDYCVHHVKIPVLIIKKDD